MSCRFICGFWRAVPYFYVCFESTWILIPYNTDQCSIIMELKNQAGYIFRSLSLIFAFADILVVVMWLQNCFELCDLDWIRLTKIQQPTQPLRLCALSTLLWIFTKPRVHLESRLVPTKNWHFQDLVVKCRLLLVHQNLLSFGSSNYEQQEKVALVSFPSWDWYPSVPFGNVMNRHWPPPLISFYWTILTLLLVGNFEGSLQQS